LKSVQKLWEKLETGEALTIPHHLGIQWGRYVGPLDGPGLQDVKTGDSSATNGPKLDWTLPHDERLRPVLEMYSEHGTSELYNPNDPLAYEQVRFTGATSGNGPHYARDAWVAGLPMGVVAASDNHTSHPGLAHTGLTAVIAPELTREAVFDAILARHTYATTGARILLDINVAGVAMGQSTRATGDVSGSVSVVAPGDIAYAEVIMNVRGTPEWRPIARWDDPGKMLTDTFLVSVGDGAATIYLRCELKQLVNGRVARAWSSPVWIN